MHGDQSDSPRGRPNDALGHLGQGAGVTAHRLHHLLIYGPLAPSAEAAWPDLVGFVQQDGRLAVQVFLVIGGYLAARSLWPAPESPRVALRDWPARVLGRFRRLWPLWLLALAAALLAAAFARAWMADDDTPAAPTWSQLLAHLFMLQDIAEVPALSAGLWYVSIDLQLFAVLAALAALARVLAWRSATISVRAALGAALLIAAVAASLLRFNLQDDGDIWAPYFLGAYGMGVLAAWGSQRGQRAGAAALLTALSLLALLIEWRSRIALAGVTALVLLAAPGSAALARSRVNTLMTWLARISFAVFLLHYPLSLVVNTLVMRWAPGEPAAHIAALLATWLLSLGCGWLAWRWLESPRHGTRDAVRPASRTI